MVQENILICCNIEFSQKWDVTQLNNNRHNQTLGTYAPFLYMYIDIIILDYKLWLYRWDFVIQKYFPFPHF